MPKPDGSLYWYEKERLEAEGQPKRKVKRKPVGVAKGVTNPIQSETSADVSSQKLTSICDGQSGSSNAVSPVGVIPIKKPNRTPHPLAPGKKYGRPISKIRATPEKIAAICADIRMGLSIDSACAANGISRQGVDKWRKRNRLVDEQFQTAEADFEKTMVARLAGFSGSDGKWAAWLLERRMSGRWAQVSKQELTGKDGGPQLTIAKTLVGTMGVQGDAKGDKGGKVVPMQKAS